MKVLTYKVTLIAAVFPTLILAQWFRETKKFSLSMDPIDIVIACHEKDKDVLQVCIKSVKKYIKNARRIIVISEKKLTSQAEWFNEDLFPFSKKSIELEFSKIDPKFYSDKGKKDRIGWYFKQILNFYSLRIIPNISDNVLILDSDVIFLKPIQFIDQNGIMLHGPGEENHLPYFEHMNKLLPGLKRVIKQYSGISHHMLFQRPIIEDLFSLVESYHKTSFWKAYCHCVNPKDIALSGAADYEIYFNFLLMRSNQYKIRPLKWRNIQRISDLKYLVNKNTVYDFVACHHWQKIKENINFNNIQI